MKSSALRRTGRRTSHTEINEESPLSGMQDIGKIEPRRIVHPSSVNGHGDPWLRMFTEEEVSDLLRVSLSQLRKWRMKKNRGNAQGPPFRKIGRLVRYPGHALRAYINGQQVSCQE
jgi:hypothetical protein